MYAHPGRPGYADYGVWLTRWQELGSGEGSVYVSEFLKLVIQNRCGGVREVAACAPTLDLVDGVLRAADWRWSWRSLVWMHCLRAETTDMPLPLHPAAG